MVAKRLRQIRLVTIKEVVHKYYLVEASTDNESVSKVLEGQGVEIPAPWKTTTQYAVKAVGAHGGAALQEAAQQLLEAPTRKK